MLSLNYLQSHQDFLAKHRAGGLSTARDRIVMVVSDLSEKDLSILRVVGMDRPEEQILSTNC